MRQVSKIGAEHMVHRARERRLSGTSMQTTGSHNDKHHLDMITWTLQHAGETRLVTNAAGVDPQAQSSQRTAVSRARTSWSTQNATSGLCT